MSTGFKFVVAGLEHRYDHYSSRTIAKEALAAAGLKEQDAYSPAELQKLVDSLAGIGSGNFERVWAALGVRPTGSPAPAAVAEPPKAEAKNDEKAAAKPAAPAPPPPEPPKEEAKAEKKEAKADEEKPAAKDDKGGKDDKGKKDDKAEDKGDDKGKKDDKAEDKADDKGDGGGEKKKKK